MGTTFPSVGRRSIRTLSLLAAASLIFATGSIVDPSRAEAAFHVSKIKEVFAGTELEPRVQFLEIQMYSNGQNLTGGHDVVFYDADGTESGVFTFPTAVANGTDQASILVATNEAAAFFGVTPDLTMLPVMDPKGGMACYDGVDCISWGAFSGAPKDSGTPFRKSGGFLLGASIERDIRGGSDPEKLDGSDDSDNSAADLRIAAPTPENNAGITGEAPGGAISFSVSRTKIAESRSVMVKVMRSEDSSRAVTVDYRSQDRTAKSGRDYASASGTLTFGPGETSKMFTVAIAKDRMREGREAFKLNLSNPVGGAVLGLPATITVVIVDR